MKLSKALKVKNRLAGEIGQAQKMVVASNVVEGRNTPPFEVEKLMKELWENQKKLAALKGKISVANGPIAERIFLMAELKARIAFLRTIPTQDGTFTKDGRYGQQVVSVDYKAHIKAVDIENEVKALSLEIEKLQDEVDEFNAKTEI